MLVSVLGSKRGLKFRVQAKESRTRILINSQAPAFGVDGCQVEKNSNVQQDGVNGFQMLWRG